MPVFQSKVKYDGGRVPPNGMICIKAMRAIIILDLPDPAKAEGHSISSLTSSPYDALHIVALAPFAWIAVAGVVTASKCNIASMICRRRGLVVQSHRHCDALIVRTKGLPRRPSLRSAQKEPMRSRTPCRQPVWARALGSSLPAGAGKMRPPSAARLWKSWPFWGWW